MLIKIFKGLGKTGIVEQICNVTPPEDVPFNNTQEMSSTLNHKGQDEHPDCSGQQRLNNCQKDLTHVNPDAGSSIIEFSEVK